MSFKIEDIEILPSYKLSTKEDPVVLFDFIDQIGQGAFGTVWKAKEKASENIVALKQIDVNGSSSLGELITEIKFMSQLVCKYVVQYHCSYLTKKDTGAFTLWISMEYCDAGSVNDLMEITKKAFTETQISLIMKDSLRGLHFLHKNKRLHRDIKAANIMLTESGKAKLGDFGISGEVKDFTKHHTAIGTPYWMAPEVITENYDQRADIWSLGITAIELAEGQPPLSDIHPMRAIFMIPRQPPPTLTTPSIWSESFNDFIAKTLVKDPEQRPAAILLLKGHPFIKNISKKVKPKEQFKAMFELAHNVINSFGSKKKALNLESSESDASDDSIEAGGTGDYGTTKIDSNSGTTKIEYGTTKIEYGTTKIEYGTTKIDFDANTTKIEREKVDQPDFMRHLSKPPANKYLDFTRERLVEIDDTLDKNLNSKISTLKEAYETDVAILQELLGKK
jgi:serine/threonine kinase 3